jgi:hypothetical protein
MRGAALPHPKWLAKKQIHEGPVSCVCCMMASSGLGLRGREVPDDDDDDDARAMSVHASMRTSTASYRQHDRTRTSVVLVAQFF